MYWICADVSGRYAHRSIQTYLLLTKRPPRMRAWLAKWADRDTRVDLTRSAAEHGWCDQEEIDNAPFMPRPAGLRVARRLSGRPADCQHADPTAAAVRFVSAQPLLGPPS
jgi:protein gp37